MIDIIQRIKIIIDEKIRSLVQSHNGDIIFNGYDNGVVSVTLTGACIGCPFLQATLMFGVLEILKEHLPEVIDIRLMN